MKRRLAGFEMPGFEPGPAGKFEWQPDFWSAFWMNWAQRWRLAPEQVSREPSGLARMLVLALEQPAALLWAPGLVPVLAPRRGGSLGLPAAQCALQNVHRRDPAARALVLRLGRVAKIHPESFARMRGQTTQGSLRLPAYTGLPS